MAVESDQPVAGNTESGASMAKLHGRAFYESIGSPKYVVAPMVDQSEFAWRMLSRSFLPDSEKPKLLAYTPMFHARHFGNDEKYRRAHFEATRKSDSTEPWLDGNPKIDRPLFVQFCANDPEALLAAAKEAAPYCDAVDLNLGCPQGIARKGHYGAFLQEDQDLIFKLINKLHKELPVPVTAKIRLLDTKEESLAYAQNVLKAGASILTVHGRRREQKGHLTGLADWEMIKYIRDNLPPETVLFANGNILQHGDVQSLIEATGADAVMSADGNLSDPGIFAQAPAPGQEGREYWRGKDGAGGWRLDAVMRRYLDLLYKYALDQEPPVRKPLWIPGEDAAAWLAEADQEDGDGPPPKRQKKETFTRFSEGPNMHAVKAHLFHLLRHLVSKHTDVRDDLAKSSREGMPAYERVLAEVEKRSIQGMQEYIDTDGKSFEAELEPLKEDGEVDQSQSSKGTMRRCKRPWWVAQPIVRPLPSEALAKGAISLSKKDKKAKDGEESANGQTTGQEKKAEVEGLKEDLKAKDELVSG